MTGREIGRVLPWHQVLHGAVVCMLAAAATPASGQSAVRNVSPPGVAIPQVTAPLQRIERPRPQAARQTEAAALPVRNFYLARPLVLEKATLTSGKLTVELAHIAGLAASETCQTDSGQSWPCGARALTALRALLRSHRVDCEPVAPLGPGQISATCSRGSVDLGFWMLQQGWAQAAAGAPEGYAAAEAAARSAGLGQWQRMDFEPLPQTILPPQSVMNGLPDEAAPPQQPALAGASRTGEPAGAAQIPAWENPFDVPEAGSAEGPEIPSADARRLLPSP